MTSSDSPDKLSHILADIFDTALLVHEQLEKTGINPLVEFERCLLPGNRRLSDEDRARILWNLLVFTQPRIASQRQFQNLLNAKLPNTESAIIVRQIICSPPRAWSYRKSYQRGFAHTLAGPNAHNEISVNGCLNTFGTPEEADHLYVIGWTITFEDEIYLVCADTLTQKQVYDIEGIKPFPLQVHDDDFWEESMIAIIQKIYEAFPTFSISPLQDIEYTDYAPERMVARLGQILACSTQIVKTPLQVTVALQSPEKILAAVQQMIKEKPGESETFIRKLRLRLLESVGCDENGNMPRAHASLLAADPIALLLLPDSHPVFQKLNPRDPIKLALQFEETQETSDISDAFEVYQHERRWLAAFPCCDFACEEHASKFGFPVDSIRAVFDPRLFETQLPIAPQGEFLRQIQRKYGYYSSTDQNYSFGVLLNAAGAVYGNLGKNTADFVQWLMNCCERWRYCLSHIEPDTAKRTLNQDNQKLLHKGLKELSAMFKKKS